VFELPCAPSVLVVDERPADCNATVRHLSQAGLFVVTARDYKSAVRALERVTPDVVCIDLALPTYSGYALCDFIRTRPATFFLPILVTADRAWLGDLSTAERAGANAFLRKPFTRAALIKSVSALLGGPQPTRRV
jgi:CheY-like chemotaxis protein